MKKLWPVKIYTQKTQTVLINLDKIVHLHDSPEGKTFKVPIAAVQVNRIQLILDLGICSCPVGKTGGSCKHQAAVLKVFRSANSINCIPLTSREGQRLFSIVALGKDKWCKESWYEGLHDSPSTFPAESDKLSSSCSTFRVVYRCVSVSSSYSRRDFRNSGVTGS